MTIGSTVTNPQVIVRNVSVSLRSMPGKTRSGLSSGISYEGPDIRNTEGDGIRHCRI